MTLQHRGRILARQVLLRTMYARLAQRNRRVGGSAEIRRIVVIRPDHLGDLLFATPALSRIREAFPEAHLTGAVGPWGRAMWESNPDLDALITIPFPGIAGPGAVTGGPLAPYRLVGKAARTVAAQKYDLGIALRFDHWWGAALMWASGVPRRWGYDTPGMGAWLTKSVPYTAGKHEVEQNLRLAEGALRGVGARYAGGPRVDRERGEPGLRPPLPTSTSDVEKLLGEWMAAERRAIIHPGTGAANKLWTIAGWAEVINNLRSRGWAIALTGSPGERILAEVITSACENDAGESAGAGSRSIVNVAGHSVDLGELAWVLKEAHLVLGVDSGPLHMAAALHRPTVHLYGPSDETIWGPWGSPDKHRVLRAPNTRPTMRLDVGSREIEGGPEMRAITPEMVMGQIEKLQAGGW